jgi:hypothetical protein
MYRKHFVDRFELDELDHPAVKRRISEETIRAKIEEAIPKIDEIVYGKEIRGVIASQSARFAMLFHAIETDYGYELNMFNMSNRVDFKPKSAKEVVIQVNPAFTVRFADPYSFSLKISILADISENWRGIEPGVLYHLGGDIIDYWLERAADVFYITGADWEKDLIEIEVT